jgi:Glycosyl transferases group 1
VVHAFAALPPETASRMKCIVVGARYILPCRKELRRKATGLPSDRSDRFEIIDETGETAEYWLAADVFCCTSRIESYPRAIQEAMACNLPIITMPVFGIAEQIRPGINLADAETTDAAEDEAHGRDRSGDEIPDNLKRRESRMAKILEAQALLEERACADTAEAAAHRQTEGDQGIDAGLSAIAPETGRLEEGTQELQRAVAVAQKLDHARAGSGAVFGTFERRIASSINQGLPHLQAPLLPRPRLQGKSAAMCSSPSAIPRCRFRVTCMRGLPLTLGRAECQNRG